MKLYPYAATRKVKFLPISIKYGNFCINFGDFEITNIYLRIPGIGLIAETYENDYIHKEKRMQMKRLRDYFNSDAIEKLYENKLRLQLNYVEAASGIITTHVIPKTAKELLDMTYREMPGHFLVDTVVDYKDQHITRKLPLVLKLLNEGYSYSHIGDVGPKFYKGNKIKYISDTHIKKYRLT